MSNSLQNFYQKMVGDQLLTQNLFNIRFNLNSVPTAVVDALDDIQLYATAAAVPGLTQNTADISYRGVIFKYPTNVTFEQEYSLNLRCDAAHKVRSAILAWINYISGININDSDVAPGGDKRIGDNIIELDLLDPGNMTPVTTYTLHGVIPTSVGNIEMSQETADPATFDFGLVYQFFTFGRTGEHVNSGVIGSGVLDQARDLIDKAQKVVDIVNSF